MINLKELSNKEILLRLFGLGHAWGEMQAFYKEELDECVEEAMGRMKDKASLVRQEPAAITTDGGKHKRHVQGLMAE